MLKKHGQHIVLVILLVAVSISSVNLWKLEKQKRQFKADLIELSDIKYGMFNVDKWKSRIGEIISKKIKEIDLSGENREVARKKISRLLHQIVDEFEANYKRENEKKVIIGTIRNWGADLFDIFGEFRNNIPNITQQILDFLNDKENREKIKAYILEKLDAYSAKTFQKMDYSVYHSILDKYDTKNADEAREKINLKIDKVQQKLNIYDLIVGIIFLGVILILIFGRFSKIAVILMTLIALHFLILGLLLPMIDIDARIGKMEFMLLGEKVSFANQVLYYKSKSILEMAKIMLSQGTAKIFIVGLLVLIFSVIFPIFKLLSTITVMIKEKWINHKFFRFIIFKSGKWSMTDVFVVAIFMSYIGFTGIISNQLAQLEKVSKSLTIITTNHSELQSGFFYFVAFVFISLGISQKIANHYKI